MSLTQSKTGVSKDKGTDKQRNQLIAIDKKYALMKANTQREVKSVLENELDYLLGRKERESMKKRKLQEMEDAYEKNRISRIQTISSKISKSDRNRSLSLREKQIKSKRGSEYFDSVKKKIEHSNQEQLAKMMKTRKDYLLRQSPSRASQKSVSTTKSYSESRIKNLSLELEQSKKNIDSQINRIEARIEQAKTKSLFYHQQKAKNANRYTKDYHEIMEKVNSKQYLEETTCFRQYYQRATHIIECKERSKSFYVKESQRRKQNIEQRFKKCNQNLETLDKQRQSRIERLQTKFDKTVAPKTWRNEKNAAYLERFIKNQKTIEFEKSLRAQSILKKHQDLSLKNKAIRQKKDKIFQAVKKMEA